MKYLLFSALKFGIKFVTYSAITYLCHTCLTTSKMLYNRISAEMSDLTIFLLPSIGIDIGPKKSHMEKSEN